MVLDAVQRDPVAAGTVQLPDRVQPADQLRRLREPAVVVRVQRHDHDQPQLRTVRERLGEGGRDLGRPEVLVLDVHQPAGQRQHLAVRPCDAVLPARREREPVPPPVRVRPQQLDGVAPARGRVGQLRRQRTGDPRFAVHPVPLGIRGAHPELGGAGDDRHRVALFRDVPTAFAARLAR